MTTSDVAWLLLGNEPDERVLLGFIQRKDLLVALQRHITTSLILGIFDLSAYDKAYPYFIWEYKVVACYEDLVLTIRGVDYTFCANATLDGWGDGDPVVTLTRKNDFIEGEPMATYLTYDVEGLFPQELKEESGLRGLV